MARQALRRIPSPGPAPAPSELEAVAAVLGGSRALGRRVRTPEELGERVREGLPFDALRAVMDTYEIPREAICAILGLSQRNFPRRQQRRRLAPDESDRLYRLARVLAHADRVFEDPARSAEWIRTPNAALARRAPLERLDTDIGVQQVDEILGRVEHGIAP
jgi:putative toxin-antitoxin system antitoxin component (TIGR02293 family)